MQKEYNLDALLSSYLHICSYIEVFKHLVGKRWFLLVYEKNQDIILVYDISEPFLFSGLLFCSLAPFVSSSSSSDLRC